LISGAAPTKPNVFLRTIGKVPKDALTDIEMVLRECYRRLEPHNVELLDLLVFENATQMNSFYASEKETSGVTSETLSERFFAVHDAWRGTPRIGICLEAMAQLPRLIQIGSLRHEVGHSVLHGSLEYYVFSITPPLLQATRRLRLGNDYSFTILYLISVAVKDFEVTTFLVQKEYVEDQVGYSLHALKSSEDDLTAWRMAEGNSAAEALCLAGRLKDTACTIAIRNTLQRPLAETLRQELSYLPDRILTKFLSFAEVLPKRLTGETLENVNATVRLFVETFLKPTF